MHGVGAKLSKHVLGMKFMRKTKDQLDKDKVEKTHREHFSVDIKGEPASVPQSQTVTAEEVPSYSQCIGYNFGRASFGGFNPIVEYNISHGIWTASKADKTDSDEGDGDDNSVNEYDIKKFADGRGKRMYIEPTREDDEGRPVKVTCVGMQGNARQGSGGRGRFGRGGKPPKNQNKKQKKDNKRKEA